ncbi:aromatic ring-hydroxylating oxygenase subunit alpha [Polynucleobacter cosmopolitanus]|uniref:aromatic ring-hydroxylating oxygenase subunit alpha n=1 Tax=Polynucleobacter cosmopolitanus TaxID=351345 RepID=UPI0015DB4E03|nr:Rieske 2Fe-2S domain-containing protein [Polynucleobacter cosmopolitanus]
MNNQVGYQVNPNDYFDEDYFNEELSNILNKYWIFLCPESILKKENDYFVFKGFEKEIVLKRVSDNQIVSFNNVCMHRGHKLFLDPIGNSETRCQYHGWLYGGDLALKNIPWNDKCYHLNKDEVSLEKFCEIRVQDGCVWGYFGKNDSQNALYPASEVSEQLKLFNQYSSPPFSLTVNKKKFNWKLIFENLYDRVHPTFLHKNSLNKNFDINFKDYPKDFSVDGVEDFVKANIEQIGSQKNQDMNNAEGGNFPLSGYVNGHIFPFLHFLTPNSGNTFSYESYIPVSKTEVIIYTFWVSSSLLPASNRISFLTETLKGASKVLNEDWDAVESISEVKQKPKNYYYGAHEKSFYGLKKLGQKK